MPSSASSTVALSSIKRAVGRHQNRVQIAKVYPVFALLRRSPGNHRFQKARVFREKQAIRRLSDMRHGTTEPKG